MIEALPDDTPLIGNGDFADFVGRLVVGSVPLLGYGLVGGTIQLLSAPFDNQIPLGSGFTLVTPFSSAEKQNVIGVPGMDQSLQTDALVRGQTVPFTGGMVRTHTTTFMDWAVRNGLPFADLAQELVHPGRVALLRSEESQPPLFGDRFGTMAAVSRNGVAVATTDQGVIPSGNLPIPRPADGNVPSFPGLRLSGKRRRSGNNNFPCTSGDWC